MACTRRSLTTGYTLLSRRLHPSLSYIPNHDRDNSTPSQQPPPPIHRYTQTFGFGFGSSLPFALRNYSSAPGGPTELNYIKDDIADVLSDTTTINTAVAASSSIPAPFPGEVAAAAADSFFPVAALQHVIDAVHTFTGFNWWACIAVTTLLIRCGTIPLLLNQMKTSVKLAEMRPEMEALKEEMQNTMDPQSMQEYQKKTKALFQKHGVTPFSPLKGLFIQGPIFISFFFAIQNMVEKVPSFKGGGAYIFTDLTTPDPLYVLPVLTGLTFLVTVELNMQEGMEGNPMAKTMKNFSRVLGIATVPFTASFPKAIFCYWVTSNMFSLVYGIVLKRPQVRKFLNLPDISSQPSPNPPPNFSFFGGSKPVIPPASQLSSAKESEPLKSSDRRTSSSAVISHRIRNLEKTVKARSKTKKR